MDQKFLVLICNISCDGLEISDPYQFVMCEAMDMSQKFLIVNCLCDGNGSEISFIL